VPDLYARRVKDDEYIGRVRRHRPSSLLPLIAAEGARYCENQSWLSSPYKKLTPWALADIARVSLASGNEHRKDATPRDVLECAAAYVALAEPELGKTPDAAAGFILRINSEQLALQKNIQNELGRSVALFDQTTAVRPLQVMHQGWAERLLGCTVSQYVGIGFILHTGAKLNGGRFSVDWIANNPHTEPITSEIPPDLMQNVLDTHFTANTAYFKEKDRIEFPSQLRRFTHNPLTSRPVVSGVVPELLVPVPGQLVRKVSPLGIYYTGLDKWGKPFADDVGDFFEQYVGHLLKLINGATVYGEIAYGRRGNNKSVDWIVVCQQAVLLVEVKSARPIESVRIGSDEAWSELTKKLSPAFTQVEKTNELIAASDPEFAHIPNHLPRIGIVVTMEPMPSVNLHLIRSRFAPETSIPVTICPSEDLEWIVSLNGRTIDSYLLDFLNDPAKAGWDVATDLGEADFGPNAVLNQAWAAHSWLRPPESAVPS
jgi:hypothetical protein